MAEVIHGPSMDINAGPTGIGQRAKLVVEAAIIGAEVSPLNEAIRYGALGASIAAGLDPIISTAVIGAATLAVEAPAALAAADALQSPAMKRAVDKVNDRLERIGVSPDAKLNILARAGIAWLGGSAISVILRHREAPERTYEEDKKYGLRAATTLAGVSAVQGYLISKGIEHPSFTSIGELTVALGGMLGFTKFIKKKLNGSGETLNADVKRAKFYEEFIEQATRGPQREGLDGDPILDAINDPKTVFTIVSVNDKSEEVPAIVPIEYAKWYNPEFYSDYEEQDGNGLFYLAVPHDKLQEDPGELIARFKEQHGGGIIFYDYLDSDVRSNTLIFDNLPDSITLAQIEKGNGKTLDASLELLAAPVEIVDAVDTQQQAGGKYMQDLQNIVDRHPEYRDRSQKVRILDKPVSDLDFEDLWSFYPEVFKKHNADHPLLQSFDEHEFREMLNSSETIWAVAANDAGRIISATFIAQLEECDWLRPNFYKENYPEHYQNGAIIHIPTIVTRPEYRREGSVVDALEILASVIREKGSPFLVLGESTDATREVVPLIADAFFNDPRTGMKTNGMKPIAMYRYGALKVS